MDDVIHCPGANKSSMLAEFEKEEIAYKIEDKQIKKELKDIRKYAWINDKEWDM